MALSCNCVLSLGFSDPGGSKLFLVLQAWNRDMASLQSTFAGGLCGEPGCVWSPGTTKPHCGSEVLGSHPVSSSWPWLKSSLKSSVSSSPVLVYQPPLPSFYNPAGFPQWFLSWCHRASLCITEKKKTKTNKSFPPPQNKQTNQKNPQKTKPKPETERELQNLFFEASISLILKLGKIQQTNKQLQTVTPMNGEGKSAEY